jgi:rod shape-determining protein MreD
MVAKIFQNARRFFFLLLLQVVVLNHILLSGYLNPYVYILFVMLLPIETPAWMVLASGFFTGLILDMFSNTNGMHAAALTLMAFARPGVLKLIAPRDGYETESALSPNKLGLKWFITYASLLTLVFHFAYFYIEVFRFSEFFITFFKAVLNSAITLLLILLGMFLFGKQKSNERTSG